MSTNFASLGIAVESSDAVKATDDLGKLVTAAEGAEKAVDGLSKASDGLAGTGKKVAQAEAEAALGIEKSTGARERQVGASRKVADSAVAEIAIIRQLDKAMTGNIDSMESLIQAEGLLERARKGGLVTIEQQEAYQERLGKSFERIEKAESKELAQKQRLIDAENRRIEGLKRTVNGIDPVTNKLARLEERERALNELHKIGVKDANEYNEALAKIGKDRSGLTATETAFDKLKLGTRQAQENVMQLTNALQSGDWGSGARAVAQLGAGAGASAKSMAAMLIPAGLLVAVLGSLGYAYLDAMKQAREFNAAINGGSNDAGQTIGSLKEMAEGAGRVTGNLSGAREAVVSLASGVATSGTQMRNLAEAAAAISEITGQGAGELAKSFATAGDTATEAAGKISSQYGLLTLEQYQVIKAIDDQGDHQRALDVLSEDLNQSALERLKTYRTSLSDVERDWDDIKNAIKGAYAAVRSEVFPDLAKQIEITQRVLDTRKGGGISGAISNGLSSLNSALGLGTGEHDDSTPALEAKLADLKARQAASESLTASTGESTRANKELIATEKELSAQLNDTNPLNKRLAGLKKLDEKFTKLYQYADRTGQKSPLLDGVDFDGKKFSGGAYDTLLKGLEDKNKDPKAAGNQVDLTAFNKTKNSLAAIVDEYKNAQKELDAAQKAGLVSQSDYALKRAAMIGNERDEVTAAYEAEIAALEATKGKKSTTAAQSIQLDQKIADARAGMVKAQKDADSQLEVLATNETGRLAKQERAISSYVQALGQQQRALELAGQRAVLGVGQGDRQNALNGELNSQQDRFAQQSLDLENQRSDPSRNMSDEEFTRKSQALADANKKATDQIRQNYADVEAAQGDWTKGATSAWENYLDSARNIAGQTKSLFGNAFSSMEDSIVNFAMTGKLSFADFTKSILADMARIATRQAASGLLGSLVGLGVSAAGSYFGGGATTSAGSTAAGYSPEVLAGWSGVTQAKGGAWSGGVQMFADGGAFTNSIVSKPTAFGMANGKTGVMGEAGEEAIMPLTRTSSGKLGVMAMGGGGAGATQINVEVHIDGDGNASSSSDDPGYDLFGKELATFVEQKYQELRTKDMRQGGVINKAIKGR
ncbi:phage tail tape measure protein [Pseudomonas brenneri]|uniref:Phage tail tape measure protein n=1 Tax=Pseudomonas brenneri TaxID=129817 RepID=A0A5B2UUR2_9PSED|nr:phage tail tape measure protein [Pseudomonas brenneri]KAA2230504.1 phage tail tape measure protein [Pseudomonas brenneri]TWR77380.1 phage tail tape measure protein [Pseudomonas brenneri]GGL49623.1 phage tail tape measure protein [Pseudomonas brenneri]SDU96373.1 phage tail tape measure protein, lambda family [Pseudomonas brenneri]